MTDIGAISSLLLLLVFVGAVVGLRFLIDRAVATRLGPKLHHTWLGLLVFVAICFGGAIGSASIALAGLTSGSVHCFGRRCGSLSFKIFSSPDSYWLGVALWSALAMFFIWATLRGIVRFTELRRNAP